MRSNKLSTGNPGASRWGALGALLLTLLPGAAALGRPAVPGPTNAITWDSTVIRKAQGCGDWAPTEAADGNIYTPYGDCWGVTHTLTPKRSMGLARITGSPATGNLGLADIDTGKAGVPDIDLSGAKGGLDALGDGKNGKKPSGLLYANGTLYAWIRNIKTNGTQSRLRYATSNPLAPRSSWAWASWKLTEFGYPVFVQGTAAYGSGTYAYIVAADTPSAYVPGNRFVLMRVPVAHILDLTLYEFFSGTPAAPAWVSFANRASRTAIFTSNNLCMRTGMSYDAARGRFYWWQQIPFPTVDTRTSGGFGVYSATDPQGPWTTVYYADPWDMGPGEKADFPTAWMGHEGIASPGTLYLLFSGADTLSIRKGTIAAGF
jgi:hypothetical protein